MWIWHLGTWFIDGLGSAELLAGLNDTEVFSELSNSLESRMVDLCPWAQVAERHPVYQGLALTVTWSLLLKILSQLFLSQLQDFVQTPEVYTACGSNACCFIIRKPKALNQVSQSLFPIKPGKTK